MSLRSHELVRLLGSTQLFAVLGAEPLSELAAGMERVSLVAGETLFHHGDHGDAMYLLAEGRLDVRVSSPPGADTVLDRLRPGDVLGEMALLTDDPRSATIVATAPSTLHRLDRAGFDRIASSHPELLEHAHRVMRPRLERARSAALLGSWFGARDADAVAELLRSVRTRVLQRGDALYQDGDAPAAVYLVVSGRIGSRGGAGNHLHAPAARGRSVGGHAFLTGQPHDHSAVAARDSTVLEIPAAVAEANPTFLRTLVRDTLGGAPGAAGEPSAAPTTIALVPLDHDAPARALGDALLRCIEGWERAALVGSSEVDARFGTAAASQSDPSSSYDLAVSTWLDECERSFHRLVYLAEPDLGPWTRRCLRQADMVLLVASAEARPDVRSLEEGLRAFRPDLATEIALVHPDAALLPRGTRAWLGPRAVRAHHHLRLSSGEHVARLARRLTGRGHAVALSGGGARGYAHIGMLRAIAELDIPIDMIVGTSMGALVGAIFASTGSHEPCLDAIDAFGDPKKILDYTLPVVALTRSRKVTAFMKGLFGETSIEDLWIPFACLSTNLTRSEVAVHERGPLWRAVRASTAIPGVFTPVMMDGDVMIDGGVMNNFPVDVARERLGPGVVIASDAHGSGAPKRELRFGDDISGWRALVERLLPGSMRTMRTPSLLGTLMRANSVSSRSLSREVAQHADVVVRHDTDHASALGFDRHGDLIEGGYGQALAALRAWMAAAATAPAGLPLRPGTVQTPPP